MAILASALDSAMDVLSSLINLFAAREAVKPPDAEHEYGHGKIESLAGLFQSLAILGSGVFLIVESARRLVAGSFVRDIPAGMTVMAFSLFVTLCLVARLAASQRKTGSLILSTEILHYTSDILSNGGALAALFIIRMTGFVIVDLIFSIAISLYIFKVAAGIGRRCIDELLDRSIPDVSREDIARIIREYDPDLGGLHNFRSRKAGARIFLDFHVEIRGEKDFKKAHLMTEGLIDKIHEKYPEADVTVHYDPEGER